MKRTRSFRGEIITLRFHVGFSNAVRFAKPFVIAGELPCFTHVPQELKKFMQRSSALQEVPSDGFGFQGTCVKQVETTPRVVALYEA